MIPTPSFLARTGHNLLLGSLLALGLAGCGASPQSIGEAEQPISADDDADGSESDACAVGSAAGTASTDECQAIARGLCFATAEAACACAGCGSDECGLAESFPPQAFCPPQGGDSDPDEPSDPNGPTSSDPHAPVSSGPTGGGSSGYPGTGAGAPGCGEPGQTDPSEPNAPAACSEGVPRDTDGNQPCDFMVGDACFDSSELACACAGCSEGQCLVLESYPAQIRCQ
jgi:hypothetical protein